MVEDLPPEALPRLRNPIMIAAFEGWNDAGEAAEAGGLDAEVGVGGGQERPASSHSDRVSSLEAADQA
jgi:hypothetical protein